MSQYKIETEDILIFQQYLRQKNMQQQHQQQQKPDESLNAILVSAKVKKTNLELDKLQIELEIAKLTLQIRQIQWSYENLTHNIAELNYQQAQQFQAQQFSHIQSQQQPATQTELEEAEKIKIIDVDPLVTGEVTGDNSEMDKVVDKE